MVQVLACVHPAAVALLAVAAQAACFLARWVFALFGACTTLLSAFFLLGSAVVWLFDGPALGAAGRLNVARFVGLSVLAFAGVVASTALQEWFGDLPAQAGAERAKRRRMADLGRGMQAGVSRGGGVRRVVEDVRFEA